MKNIFLLFLLCICFAYPQSTNASEKSLQHDVKHDVSNLFAQRDFNRLERISYIYLNEKSRTPSGSWKISLFGDAIRERAEVAQNREIEWEWLFGSIDLWLYKYPNSSMAKIMKGQLLSSFAWSKIGFEDAVSEKEMQQNQDILKSAALYMFSIKEEADINPEWYSVMAEIMTGLGEKDDALWSLLDEGIRKHPEYFHMYYSVMNYLHPDKAGNLEEIKKFAKSVATNTDSDNDKDIYARLYLYIFQLEGTAGKKNLFGNSDIRWVFVKQGIKKILNDHPSDWNTNHFAYMACMAKDKDFTKEIWSMIKKVSTYYWDSREIRDACENFINGNAKKKLKSIKRNDFNYQAATELNFENWAFQLQYTLPNISDNWQKRENPKESYYVHTESIKQFYKWHVTEDYKRNLQTKVISSCDTDKIEEQEEQMVSQTVDEFIRKETAPLDKIILYDTYELNLKTIKVDDKNHEANADYVLKMTGIEKDYDEGLNTMKDLYPVEEIRACKGLFKVSKSDIKLKTEDCEVLIKKGCKL